MDRVDLSGYDEVNVVNRLKYLEFDMIEFLEKRIDRDTLEERIKYVVDKFERMK